MQHHQYLHLLFVLVHYTIILPELVASKELLIDNKIDSSKNVTIGPPPEAEKCEFPLISTVLYKDQDSKELNLEYLNSTSSLNVTKSFPYQYLMLTCSAPYPIEWVIDASVGPEVSKVDKPYYYAYILDDEIRSAKNKGVDHGTTKVDGEWNHFIVRHHIGNDTLAKDSFTNLTLTCQPVPVPDEMQAAQEGENLHYNYTRPCGTALFLLRKRSSGPDKNSRNRTTLLDIQFNALALVNQDNKDKSANAKSELCIKDEQWFPPKRNATLVCSDSLKSPHLASSILPEKISVNDLQLNPAGLQEPFGVLQCAPKQGSNQSFHVPYYWSLPKLCPNEDSTLPHLYLRRSQSSSNHVCPTSDLVNEEELLSICVHNIIPNASSIYEGDKIVVTCISAIYYFAEGMKIQGVNVSNDQETQKDISETNISISTPSQELSFGPGGYRNITTSFQINDTNITNVECKAPVRKSRRWFTKGVPLDIKIPEKLSFDGFSEAVTTTEGSSESFLLCNATGDPLPILSWSRLNNGKLPTNQSTEIQSFPTLPSNGNGSHHDHIPPPTKNSSTWISSKLYLPLNETELAEYFGRYICTARNRFESIEKVFLFEKEESILGLGQHAMMKTIGKTVWFWALVILAMFVLIGFVTLLGLKLREKTGNLRFFTKAEIDEFVFGKPELLLYDSDNYEEINSYAAYLPYDRSQFEIRREQLEFDLKDIVGSGAFGTVYKGTFIENGKRLPVAVKTVNSSSDKMYFAALLSEIKVMCYIGTHENVVRLIGACTKYLDQRQIFVATEFCENGDMLSYIHKHRETFINNAGLDHVLTEDGTGVKRFNHV